MKKNLLAILVGAILGTSINAVSQNITAGGISGFPSTGSGSVVRATSPQITTPTFLTGASISATGYLGFITRSEIQSNANGNLLLTNSTNNDFALLQFGGLTASYPALKRSATGLIVRLANDSADAPLTASTMTAAELYGGSVAGSHIKAYNSGSGAGMIEGKFGASTRGSIHIGTGSGNDMIITAGSAGSGKIILSPSIGQFHITGAAAPTITACGTSPSITGSNSSFKVTVGTASPTSCQLTFASAAWSVAPNCIAQSNTDNNLLITETTTAVTVSRSAAAAFTDSSVIRVHCIAGT